MPNPNLLLASILFTKLHCADKTSFTPELRSCVAANLSLKKKIISIIFFVYVNKHLIYYQLFLVQLNHY